METDTIFSQSGVYASYAFLIIGAAMAISVAMGLIRFWTFRYWAIRAAFTTRQAGDHYGKNRPVRAFLQSVDQLENTVGDPISELVRAVLGKDLARIRLAASIAVPAGFLGTAAAMIGFLYSADPASFNQGGQGLIDWMRKLAPAFETTAVGLLIALFGVILEHLVKASGNALHAIVSPGIAARHALMQLKPRKQKL